MEELKMVNQQIDIAAEEIINSVKSVCENVGEVNDILVVKLKEAKWANDVIYVEVINRAIKIFKKEVDTTRLMKQ